jgi:hypothetical protein
MLAATIGLTPILPVIAVVPVVVIPDFVRIANGAAAPRSIGAGLAKARADCPVLTVSVIANITINNKRTVLLSEWCVVLFILLSPFRIMHVPKLAHTTAKPAAYNHVFIVNEILPSRIVRLGSIYLRHLGEVPNFLNVNRAILAKDLRPQRLRA